jgi:hypothetical protein
MSLLSLTSLLQYWRRVNRWGTRHYNFFAALAFEQPDFFTTPGRLTSTHATCPILNYPSYAIQPMTGAALSGRLHLVFLPSRVRI